jgi:hypothetical protein
LADPLQADRIVGLEQKAGTVDRVAQLPGDRAASSPQGTPIHDTGAGISRKRRKSRRDADRRKTHKRLFSLLYAICWETPCRVCSELIMD